MLHYWCRYFTLAGKVHILGQVYSKVSALFSPTNFLLNYRYASLFCWCINRCAARILRRATSMAH
ncbi:hypothetical protein D0Y50_15585 [Salinimonas sediminis]|uniref:Uncharacterized protein n=1 Tax=Salinimonas sediminis TaxID=2303538 RepID=A0A346NQ50_9ALTE|nr:hypothetical protein D0Y50_15585 [Salinimonas sediminis]